MKYFVYCYGKAVRLSVSGVSDVCINGYTAKAQLSLLNCRPINDLFESLIVTRKISLVNMAHNKSAYLLQLAPARFENRSFMFHLSHKHFNLDIIHSQVHLDDTYEMTVAQT